MKCVSKFPKIEIGSYVQYNASRPRSLYHLFFVVRAFGASLC